MHKKILFGLIGAIVATGAWATDDGRVLTTQTYVDNELSGKVDIAQGTGDNNANVGKTLVVNSSGNLELGTVSADNFVEDNITDGVTNKAPSENAVHDALENKQDAIDTAMVEEFDYTMPSLVTYDSTDGGLTGTKFGILRQSDLDSDGTNFADCVDSPECEIMIPTAQAVAEGIDQLRNEWPTMLEWNAKDTAAINNYSTTFDGTNYNWPTHQSSQFVNGVALANGLALKQNKIPARQTKIKNDDAIYAPSVVTNGTTDGAIGQMAIVTNEYIGDQGDSGTEFEDYSDNVIPTAAAVSTELKRKQNKLGGGKSQAGKVVTATATAGNVRYTAIDGTVTNASGNLVTSGAVYTAVSAKQNKMTCTRWLNNIETDENCLLWDLGN